MKKFWLFMLCIASTQLHAYRIFLTNDTQQPVTFHIPSSWDKSKRTLPAQTTTWYYSDGSFPQDLHFIYPDKNEGVVTAYENQNKFKIIREEDGRYNWKNNY